MGDQLKQADGTIGTVTGVQTVTQAKQMYNLSVGVAHTYFVGQMGWLVHNVKAPGLFPMPLLLGECDGGTYKQLKNNGTPGDSLTPHHMPANQYMRNNTHPLELWDYNTGGAINMFDPRPLPGTGRHQLTTTYGRMPRSSYYNQLSPRDALAHDVREVRRIYQRQGLYGPRVRQGLQQAIETNKKNYPLTFQK